MVGDRSRRAGPVASGGLVGVLRRSIAHRASQRWLDRPAAARFLRQMSQDGPRRSDDRALCGVSGRGRSGSHVTGGPGG